jgi:putative ABC transport system permease protein
MVYQVFLSVKMAWKNLAAAKVRTFLTILGIVIGIAAVMLVMSVGASAQRLILSQIRGVGSNLVGILPGASEETGPPASVFGVVTTTLKNSDLDAILKQVPHVVSGTGYVSGSASIKYKSEALEATYQGVSAELPKVEDLSLGAGRFFTADENDGLARVAVLGSERAKDLFGEDDPIGKNVSIGKLNFDVVGVTAPRGSVGFSSPDQMVYVPILTAQRLLLGIDYLSVVRMKVDAEENIPQVTEEVRALLRDRHDIRKNEQDDFSVRNTADALSALTNITNILKYFLTFVAGISLFVGGIGIMNIMLIALKQRVREVGLRKALGARDRDIRFQFLVESVFLALSGGTVGFLLGIVLTYLAAAVIRGLGYEWEFILTFQSTLFAFLVAAAIGIVFGLYPAKKAAKVSPMEALRYE